MDNVHPLARGEFETGTVASETKLSHMMLLLQPSAEQQEELDKLVQAQHDPKSPLYHQWLTPAQYGARFGASPADISRINTWLRSHGFAVEEVANSNRLILFSGTAGQVADTFHTELHHYSVKGVMHTANAQDPQIPRAFAGVVSGIVTLHDFRRQAQMTARTPLTLPVATDVRAITAPARPQPSPSVPAPQYTYQGANSLFPADLATIYNTNPLLTAGTNGSGVTIAIVGRSNINSSDVTEFRSSSGLSVNNPTITYVTGNPGLIPDDQDESTLDVEWSGAMAPSAKVNFVVGTSTSTTDGVDISAQYIVNHSVGQVVSTSYGNCEQDMGSTELAFYNSLWQQAATEGMSSFVSSGDSGAAGCNSGSSTTGSVAGVNGLCSSPYSTCVGGTEFNEGGNNSTYWSSTNSATYESALSYIPEKVWNESASDGGSGLWASTGGVSLVYTQPSWQQGITGTSAGGGMRTVPDVALTAAGHDAYIIVEDGNFYNISGTSAASPAFAGIMALVVQSRGGVGQGNANTSLYPLVNASQNPFHPTLTGNNSVPGVSGFTASGATYNLATGLGSVNAATLVSVWGSGASSGGSSSDFTLQASASSGTLMQGKSTTFTVSAVASGSAKNAIALRVSAPAGVTASISPTTISPGYPATITLAATSSAAAGAQNVSVTGSDVSGSQTVSYALTVTAPPSITVTAGTPSLAVTAGSSGTVSFTVATAGSYSGPMGLTLNSLPAGVTASLSPSTITPSSGTSSTTVTLTLTAASTAAAGTSNVVLTAAGDGLVSSSAVSLTVQQSAGAQVTVSPMAITIPALSAGSVTVTAMPTGGAVLPAGAAGSSATVTSGLPTGFTATWGSPTINGSGAAVWTLKLGGGTSAVGGTSTVAVSVHLVTKTGTAYTATGSVSVTVTPPPASLTISSAAPLLTVAQGASGTYAVTVTGNSTYTGSVNLAVTGLPTGVTASWSANPITLTSGTGTATLTLNVASTAKAATTNLVLEASGDGAIATSNAAVMVTPVPGLQETIGLSSLTMSHAGTGSVGASFTPLNGLSAPVTFSASGLPAGATYYFNKTSLPAPGNGNVTLTIVGSASTPTGTYMIGVTGSATSGGTTYTTTQTVKVLMN
jgi:subtilase family serine protease